MTRTSGILLHISSLPSPYGIGTLGREAFRFADFLADAGQHCWQMLPVGSPGLGNSPYNAQSAFAGNPFLIDPDLLEEDGLLLPGEAAAVSWGSDPEHVDFGAVSAGRTGLLRKAAARFVPDSGYYSFKEDQAFWLEDWALYCALKAKFGGKPWTQWPEEYRFRQPEAMNSARNELFSELTYYRTVQYLFFRQWKALRKYTKSLDITLIGDVPIYVPLDSADAWANPQLFRINDEGKLADVAGVPPDYFCEDGQLWGNPLYDWRAMEKDGYSWWLSRLRATAKLFDAVRIDHFRGLASFWAVPADETTAKNGKWLPGPRRPFIDAVKLACPDTKFIAEDLGMLTQDVFELQEYSGWPGMKVLQFAFDSGALNLYLPHRYDHNCVCYTGTHDNETLMQWWAAADDKTRAYAAEYLGLHEDEGITEGIIRGGMSSVADTFIAPMQDWLGLGAEGRMNSPGTSSGCWGWRMKSGVCTDTLAKKILTMTQRYGR